MRIVVLFVTSVVFNSSKILICKQITTGVFDTFLGLGVVFNSSKILICKQITT